MASGWYKREFDAVGIPFDQRGKLMDENLEIISRLWTEEKVDGSYMSHQFPRRGACIPKPAAAARADPDRRLCRRVLKRAGTAGDGWLTYFYQPQDFTKSWNKVRAAAEAAGKNPDELINANQLPIWSAPRARRCASDDGLAEEGMGFPLA